MCCTIVEADTPVVMIELVEVEHEDDQVQSKGTTSPLNTNLLGLPFSIIRGMSQHHGLPQYGSAFVYSSPDRGASTGI